MFWNLHSWKELERTQRDIEQALTGACSASKNSHYPPVNLYESKDSVIVTAEMPGVNHETVTVMLNDDVIVVSGEVSSPVDEKKYTAIRREREMGTYEKKIRIPHTVDHNAISVSLVNGILTITLPKTEAAKPKKIPVAIQ